MIQPDFQKYTDGLVPAIVQDSISAQVLMMGYMNEAALRQTTERGRVTFYSRSRQALWTKGETSGNFLTVKEIRLDCDRDCLLVIADPAGPVCHTGQTTCFGTGAGAAGGFLRELDEVIRSRKQAPAESSYTASLFAKGIPYMARKVGEEAAEVMVEAFGTDTELLLNESADLLFHLMVLLRAKGTSLHEVIGILSARHSGKRDA